MHRSLLLGAVMALGAVAAPLEDRALKIIDVVDVVTVTVTGTNHPTPPTATPQASSNGGGFLEGSHPPPSPPSPPPAAPPPSSGNNGAPASGSGSGPETAGVPIIDVVNKWRQKYNLNTLTWNHAMDANVQQVGENGGGVNEVHQLIPGMGMGQVISPGQANEVPANQPFSPFELVYLAWLCEVPTDPQLQPDQNDGINPCQEVHNVLNMVYSDTGHHDILVSPNWQTFSCAYTANPSANQMTATYQGLYVCDYA